jgi:hypothetical protein
MEGLMLFCVGTLQERLSEENVVKIIHTIDTFGSTCDALKTAWLDIIDLKLLRERIGLNEPPLIFSDSLLLEIERMYSKKLEDKFDYFYNGVKEVCFEIIEDSFLHFACRLIYFFVMLPYIPAY